MNIWKKFSGIGPIAIGTFVAVCTGISLAGYKAPVYDASAALQTSADSISEPADEPDSTDTDSDNGSEDAITGETAVETAASAGSAGETQTYTDGVYSGSAQGFSGTTTVQVTVSSGKITDITVLSENDTDSFFSRARAVIQNIISTQSTDVDTVSGATFSSRGIINAVKNALAKAGGTPASEESSASGSSAAAAAASSGESASVAKVAESGTYKDGTYEGTGRGFNNGTTRVSVVVSGGKIASVTVLSNQDTAQYFSRASVLTSRIVSAQSTNVDTVSGATFSSRGIIEAVRNALSKAGGSSQASPSVTASPTPVPSEKGSFPYKDGIYEGVGEGRNDEIHLYVVIQDEQIKAVLVKSENDDEEFFSRAMTGILQAVISNQKIPDLDVDKDVYDAVSGATMSSEGLVEALEDAVEKAKEGKDIDYVEPTASPSPSDENVSPTASGQDVPTVSPTSAPDSGSETPVPTTSPNPDEPTVTPTPANTGTVYTDGTYTETVTVVPDEDEDFSAYNLTAKVTISGDRITAVTDVSGDGGSGNNAYIRRASEGRGKSAGIIPQVTEKGNADGIDTVSGATCSSKGLIEICRKALEEAVISK